MKKDIPAEKLEDLIDKLHQRFEGAIRFLKQTPVSTIDPRVKLYALPWFLMLGFPSSGKTSLLSHSHMDFLLSKKSHTEKHRVSHCEWWATKEAVFLDVNNAYMLQNRKTRRQRKLWFDFLELLRTHRRQQTFEGLIFCIDVEKLCSTNKNERNAYFHSIRGRLKDLMIYSKQPFPLYFTLTKSDKLAGFNEFFDSFNKAEISQLWGITLNQLQIQSPQALADAFDLEFDRLLSRLNQRLIQRLHHERNIDKRAVIKNFPLQVESIKKPLAAFLQNIADITSANQLCQLRGVYLCASHPQDELALDRLQQPLSQAFSLQSWMPTSEITNHRAYFTTDIFKQLLKDREITLTYIKHNKAKFNVILQGTIAVACGLLVISLAANWVRDFSKNISQLNTIEQAMAQYQLLSANQGTINIQQSVSQLAKLAQASENVQHATLPWTIRTFLPQDAAVYSEASQTFQKTVQIVVAKQLQLSLQQQLNTPNKLNAAQLYDTLQAYLMLTNPAHRDLGYVVTILDNLWQGQLDTAQMTQMNKFIGLAFAAPVGITADENLINQSRLILNALPKTELATALFSASLPASQQLILTLPVIAATPIFNSTQSTLKVPAAYTEQVFTQVYETIAPQVANSLVNGDWVINAHPTTQHVTADTIEQVRQFYIASYIKTWQNVLGNLQLLPFKSYTQAVATVEAFTQTDSKLMQLIYQININTHVTYRNAPTPISLTFSAFDQSTNQVLAANRDNLLQLAAYLDAVQKDNNPAAAAFELAKSHTLLSQQQSDVFYALNNQLAQLPYPYNHWFNDMAKYSWQLVLTDAQKAISQAWQENVYTEFANNLAGLYPFNQNAKQDLSLDDFNHFFAQDGTLTNFVNFYLSPFIDTTQSTWQLKTFNGISLPLSQQSLNMLQQANSITQDFFSATADQMNLSFLLKPVQFSSNVKQVYLSINSQTASYSPDFMAATHFDWPGKDDTQYIAMVVSNKDGQQTHTTTSGVWSLFHWLDTMHPQQSDNKLALNYQSPPYTVALQITDNDGSQPLPLELLHGFVLPASL